jgi:hypothetical protein
VNDAKPRAFNTELVVLSGRQTQLGMWSHEMIYRVVTYDRSTERMKGNLPVPPFILDKVKSVAGFHPQDDGLGEYLLDEQQTRQIAQLLGFRPEPDRFYYYVEPYQPSDDNGLQEAC